MSDFGIVRDALYLLRDELPGAAIRALDRIEQDVAGLKVELADASARLAELEMQRDAADRMAAERYARLRRVEEAARAVCDWTLMSVDQHQAAKMQGYLRTALEGGGSAQEEA